MAKLSKSGGYIYLYCFRLVFIITTRCINISNGFELSWSTPPPLVVVADINKLYRIGCRVTLNNSVSSQHQRLDDVELWAVVSKVRYFAEY